MADGQLTAEVVESVAEGLEGAAVHLEEAADATRQLDYKAFGFMGVGIVIGFGLGYYTQQKRLTKIYAKMAAGEIAMMREHYLQKAEALQPKPPIDEVIDERIVRETPRYTPEEEAAIVETNNRIAEEEELQEEVQEVSSWDYASEIRGRTPHKPYIIHADEFENNETEYSQLTYTYYDADDVLADVHDHVIENQDDVVGLENLKRFGHGSNDEDTVFIRNDRLELDIEISRDNGGYAEQVHGVIEHSERRTRPRRKFDDDS